MKNIAIKLLLVLFAAVFAVSCKDSKEGKEATAASNRKIGVLMVNHGSRSETWRNALLDLEKRVKDTIIQGGKVAGTKTAFMEYTEPSIATRLKEFDQEGYTDVIIIPIFLTVSTHSFDDIPTIVGLKEDPKSMETLKIENIERYKPKATVHITPLLDFTDVLRKNVLRRAQAMSKDPKKEALVLIAYGDETYNKEWNELLTNVSEYVKQNTGIPDYSYGWCGHVAHYNPDSTTTAIKRSLKGDNTALVVPVLVAHDEMFQVKIIGDGINKIPDAKKRVSYLADAILPDDNVQNWVISVADKFAGEITGGNTNGK